MLSKRALVVALAGLNLLLLAALVLSSYSPPQAMAQRGGRPGDFLMATVQIHEDYDALALINVPVGSLDVFMPQATKAGIKLVWTGEQNTRNLNRDFNRQR